MLYRLVEGLNLGKGWNVVFGHLVRCVRRSAYGVETSQHGDWYCSWTFSTILLGYIHALLSSRIRSPLMCEPSAGQRFLRSFAQTRRLLDKDMNPSRLTLQRCILYVHYLYRARWKAPATSPFTIPQDLGLYQKRPFSSLPLNTMSLLPCHGMLFIKIGARL